MSLIAEQAVRAVSDQRFEDRPGWCQKWTRQVVEAVAGQRFAAMMKGSARESGLAAQRLGWTVTGPPRPGDLLYKITGSGGFGHVGIMVQSGKIAENSSTKIGRIRGAVGYRTLAQFGPYDLIVRLPVRSPSEQAVADAWPELATALRVVYDLVGRLPEPARTTLRAALNALRAAFTKAGAPPAEGGSHA